jgi:hypothetical protein
VGRDPQGLTVVRRRSSLGGLVSFYFRRKSLSRGVFGEDRFWRVVYRATYGRRIARRMQSNAAWRSLYSMASAARFARKVIRPRPRQITVGRLKPGETVRIEVVDPRSAAK